MATFAAALTLQEQTPIFDYAYVISSGKLSGFSNACLQLGESTYDNSYFTICEGDYCNRFGLIAFLEHEFNFSDILLPNGTIVGPSAHRKFANSANFIAYTPIVCFSFVKILMWNAINAAVFCISTSAWRNGFFSCESKHRFQLSQESCILDHDMVT